MRIMTTALLALLMALGLAGQAIAEHESGTPSPSMSPSMRMPERPDTDENPSVAVPDQPTGRRMMAQVLAIDPEGGRLLLGTDEGMIALRATPEQLAQLKPGDVIAVRFRETPRGEDVPNDR